MRQVVLFILFIVLVYACSRTCESDYSKPIKSPVDDLVKDMTNVSTFSIILYDMNTEGSIFKEFYHQYRIIKEDDAGEVGEEITDWQPVGEEFFQANLNNMGMEIAAKGEDGKVRCVPWCGCRVFVARSTPSGEVASPSRAGRY